jgi:PAS domain S-box-containing protein
VGTNLLAEPAVGAVVVNYRDITERHQALAALRESEQRFARFMQHLPGLAWIKDVTGRYVYANDAAQAAFQAPRAQLYGKTDEEVFPPEVAAQFRENDRRALASPAGVQVVETLEHADGVLHHSIVSKFPIPGPDGRPVLVGGMAIDLTDQVRAEQAQRAAQEQLHIVTDSMSAPVTRCSRELTYLWVSKPYADWLGRSPDDIVGRPIAEVIGQEAFASLRPYFERALSGQTVRYEEEVNFRGLGRRWVNAVYTPTRDAAGRVDGWVAVVLDIDSRKRAEQALQEADRRKDEFLAMLAHELRNPLAPISNAVQLMRMLGPEDTNLRRARDMIDRQVQHLARLVDDLLDVSRITRGKITLQKEPVELAAVIARAVETSRPLIDARRHTLTVTLPPEPVRVEADATRLAQVVSNLLHNAAKFTEEGGHIGLHAERAGAGAVVRVCDSGTGIAADLLPHVFGLFTQGDRSLARSEGGLGIGLTLVKSLVELHGGTVTAHSGGPGRGSEFVVHLPLPQRLEVRGQKSGGGGDRAPSSPTPDLQDRAAGRRVLVVDDNADAAESLAVLLRLEGHEVRTAHDGPAALEAARGFRPEVVVLDIGLPRMDGYEVARRLRAEAGLADALMVALTGYGQEEDRRRAEAAGFDAHLIKPADPAALQGILARQG